MGRSQSLGVRSTRLGLMLIWMGSTVLAYFLFAHSAIASGLMQYPMPIMAAVVIVTPFFFLAIWIVMEFYERRYDGYRAVHGYGMEHPYNKEREFL